MERVNEFAPIVPNESLGGLRLRVHLSQISHLVTGLGVSKPGSYKLVSPFEARFYFGSGSVQCAVDIRNGKVFKLIAAHEYRGTFQGNVHIGMAARDAMAIDPRLFFCESQGSILCKGVEGVVFDLPFADPLSTDVPDLAIASISVFATEISTLEGQEGRW